MSTADDPKLPEGVTQEQVDAIDRVKAREGEHGVIVHKRKLSRQIEYIGRGPQPGRPGGIQLDPRDDPFSEAFVPLHERSDRDSARWWALRQKRKASRPPAGEFGKT